MKTKSLLIISAMIISVWAVRSGILTAFFDKNGGSESRIIIKFDKNSQGATAVKSALHSTFDKVGKLSEAAFSSFGGSALIQKSRAQPVLFGCLFIFFGVSACSIGFIVHLIMTDMRFN